MSTDFTVTNHGTEPLIISVMSDENGRLFDCIVRPAEMARVPMVPGISFKVDAARSTVPRVAAE